MTSSKVDAALLRHLNGESVIHPLKSQFRGADCMIGSPSLPSYSLLPAFSWASRSYPLNRQEP